MKATRPRPAEKRPRSARTRLVFLLATAVVGAAALYWQRERPRRLYEEAQRAFLAQPQAAERLLEQSVEAAGGNYPEAQLLRCRALGAMGRWDAAIGLFSMIEDSSTCSSRDLLQLASEAQRAGFTQFAEMALTAANRPGEDQAEALEQLIRLEADQASPEAALKHCRQLQQVASEEPFAWLAEGRLQQQRKEALAASRAFREALRRSKSERQQAEIRVELVSSLMDAGDLAAARVEMDWLTARADARDAIPLKEAYLLRLEGRLGDALEKVDRLLSQSPDSAAPLMLRGILYYDEGRFREAADDLARVVEIQPFNKEAHYKLGQAYQKLGENDKAAVHLSRSDELTQNALEALALEAQVRKEPANRAAAARLAELYERLGRVAEAESVRRRSESEP